jgi:hypothetical protein
VNACGFRMPSPTSSIPSFLSHDSNAVEKMPTGCCSSSPVRASRLDRAGK